LLSLLPAGKLMMWIFLGIMVVFLAAHMDAVGLRYIYSPMNKAINAVVFKHTKDKPKTNTAANHHGKDFVDMSLFTDPMGDGKFTREWTVFYWLWWISYAPAINAVVFKHTKDKPKTNTAANHHGKDHFFNSTACNWTIAQPITCWKADDVDFPRHYGGVLGRTYGCG
jgi:hypothetical protein